LAATVVGAPAVTVMVPETTLTRSAAAKSNVRSPVVPVIRRFVNVTAPEELVAMKVVPLRAGEPD
jgi:hypothetical protein